jgi:hypothetical protein
MRANRLDTTRRALFAGAAALTGLAGGADDGQFLAWEAEYKRIEAISCGGDDDLCDELADQSAHFIDLILDTPNRGRVGALVKARRLLVEAREDMEDRHIAPLAHLVVFLQAA